jgi:hypothetical protein
MQAELQDERLGALRIKKVIYYMRALERADEGNCSFAGRVEVMAQACHTRSYRAQFSAVTSHSLRTTRPEIPLLLVRYQTYHCQLTLSDAASAHETPALTLY